MGIRDYANEQNRKIYKIKFKTKNIAEIYKIIKVISPKQKRSRAQL